MNKFIQFLCLRKMQVHLFCDEPSGIKNTWEPKQLKLQRLKKKRKTSMRINWKSILISLVLQEMKAHQFEVWLSVTKKDLLISTVNNKCKYPWLCFPLIEASFSQRKLMIRRKKRSFIYPAAPVHWICSGNLFITIWKIIFRVWIVIEHWFQSTPWKKRDENNFQARIYRKKDFFH